MKDNRHSVLCMDLDEALCDCQDKAEILDRAATLFNLKRAGGVAPIQVIGLETPYTTFIMPSINLALFYTGGKRGYKLAVCNLDIIMGKFSKNYIKSVNV